MADNQINGILQSVGEVVGTLSGATKKRVRATQDGAVRVTEDYRVMLLTYDSVAITAFLSGEARLAGRLQAVGTIAGELHGTDGMDGVLTVPPMRGGTIYDGEYEVTPSNEEQVLRTDSRILLQNIRIHKIPSNYGKITWDGRVLTVS